MTSENILQILFSNETARKIFLALQIKNMTAERIIKSLKIPSTSTYRTIELMETNQIIKVTKVRTKKGKKLKVYGNRIKKINVTVKFDQGNLEIVEPEKEKKELQK